MNDLLDLADKTILITGGGHGIGFELAKVCAADGATVLLVDASEANLSRALDELTARGAKVYGFLHDVTDRAACYALQRRIACEIGPVHVLVNNAGVVHKGGFLEADDEAWTHTVDVNLGGVMWMMRAFMPSMIAREEGHVVNMASILGIVPAGGAAVYCATKHAVIGLTESVRVELLGRGCVGVTLTVACPGLTETGMFSGVKTPRLFRSVQAHEVALALYQGIRRRARVVRYPRRYNILPQLYALLPHWLWQIGARLSGMHSAMDRFSPALRAGTRPRLTDGLTDGEE